MQLAITYRAVTDLKPYPRNARTHSRKQVKQIAAAIKEFGFTNPVLIDETDQIIAGHGRVAAAKLLGLAEVPTLQLSHLSPLQKRAYILADNRLAEKAGWDKEIVNGLLSAETKARLVFLRMKDALPGHRAFSKYAASDPRVDISNLKKICGNKFPDDP